MDEETKHIFLLGIKGVAMANIALILKKMGKSVTGADIEEEFITDEWLNKNNIPVQTSFSPEDLPQNTQLIVYSASHGGAANPLVQEAKKRGVKIAHQAQFLADLFSQFKTKIAVCGSHGKTTTTALLAYSLEQLGANPSYLVGSSSFNNLPGGAYNSKDYFVLEADEYGVNPPVDKTPKFLFLNPDIILCTNIDFDHPDVFANPDEARNAFLEFFKKAKKVILSPENKESTVKLESIASLRSDNPLFLNDKMASNMAGVVAVLLELGFEMEKIRKALQGFKGVKRRFEEVAHINDTYLFDDYAHHPAEIEATLNAARTRFPRRRIGILFQPHTYSRTRALLEEFTQSLSKADYAIIAPIFPSAREKREDSSVSSLDIEKRAQGDTIKAVSSKEESIQALKQKLQKGDVVFTMGAGDIYKLSDDIIKVIKSI